LQPAVINHRQEHCDNEAAAPPNDLFYVFSGNYLPRRGNSRGIDKKDPENSQADGSQQDQKIDS
jgi:hypothetical protein